jgi:pantetheine-phosphate adenylyltransferase
MNLQKLLDKWEIKCDLNLILSMWNESGRYWHTLDHLNDLISQIDKNKDKYTELEYEKLILISLFHDVIYDPSRTDNEERSAEFLMKCVKNKYNKDILDIKQAILDTKSNTSNNELSEDFISYDMDILNRPLNDLIQWEKSIRSEYGIYPDKKYKKGRLSFLNSIMKEYKNPDLLKLINWVSKNY